MAGMENIEVHSKVRTPQTSCFLANQAPVISRSLGQRLCRTHDIVERPAAQEVAELWHLQAPRYGDRCDPTAAVDHV
jgi:hypothetical protein